MGSWASPALQWCPRPSGGHATAQVAWPSRWGRPFGSLWIYLQNEQNRSSEWWMYLVFCIPWIVFEKTNRGRTKSHRGGYSKTGEAGGRKVPGSLFSYACCSSCCWASFFIVSSFLSCFLPRGRARWTRWVQACKHLTFTIFSVYLSVYTQNLTFYLSLYLSIELSI